MHELRKLRQGRAHLQHRGQLPRSKSYAVSDPTWRTGGREDLLCSCMRASPMSPLAASGSAGTIPAHAPGRRSDRGPQARGQHPSPNPLLTLCLALCNPNLYHTT
jgi:hypothetical protein